MIIFYGLTVIKNRAVCGPANVGFFELHGMRFDISFLSFFFLAYEFFPQKHSDKNTSVESHSYFPGFYSYSSNDFPFCLFVPAIFYYPFSVLFQFIRSSFSSMLLGNIGFFRKLTIWIISLRPIGLVFSSVFLFFVVLRYTHTVAASISCAVDNLAGKCQNLLQFQAINLF